MTDTLNWRASTYSGSQGNCVQLAERDGAVLVRNSNHPDAGTLTFAPPELAAFIEGVKAGNYDDLT